MNVLPAPGVLTRWISPPSRRAISRLIARPRPVPPYLRLVLPSACWNASKMICCLSVGMPMPVSETAKARMALALRRLSLSGYAPALAGEIRSDTRPCRVNLKAFESRFLITCWSRLASVSMVSGTSGSTLTTNSRLFDSATWRNVRST